MRQTTLTLLFLALFSFTIRPSYAQDEAVVDEIAALVGDDIILRSEVDALVQGVMRQQQLAYSDSLWFLTLNEIIDSKVLSIHAKRDTTIIVSDDQLEQTLDGRIEQMTATVGTEERVEEIYGKSIPEIKADLREDIRDQLMAEQFRGRKLRTIRIAPTEVREWFEQFPTEDLPVLPTMVRVAHIVKYPKISEEAREEANEIISLIRERVVAGESSFEEMAQLYTDDPGSQQTGGRYEGRNVQTYTPVFAAIAMREELGAISPVFETEFGLHIMRVNSRFGDVVDLNHILIEFDDSKSDPTEAIVYLNTVRDSIVTMNQPFELMARNNSDEALSASNGGRVIDPSTGQRDLVLDALNISWKQTLDTLQVGEISVPSEVELLDGRKAVHIVTLQRHLPEHKWSLEIDYDRIQEFALQEKQIDEMRSWITLLRQDVFIELRSEKARSLAANLETYP